MRRILEMLIACCFVGFTVSGCIDSEYRGLNPVGGGYVVDIDENGRILVVSSENESVSEGANDPYYEAIWYAPPEDQEPIEIGQEVNVWMEQGAVVLESYPGQASAAKIDVHEDPRPQGADYARSEAIRKALETLGEERSAPVVLHAEYSAAEDMWTVNMLDDRRDPVEAKIEDQG